MFTSPDREVVVGRVGGGGGGGGDLLNNIRTSTNRWNIKIEIHCFPVEEDDYFHGPIHWFSDGIFLYFSKRICCITVTTSQIKAFAAFEVHRLLSLSRDGESLAFNNVKSRIDPSSQRLCIYIGFHGNYRWRPGLT